MKFYVFPVFAAAVLASTVCKAEDFGLKNVKRWLDGCVALAQTTAPMKSTMELDCLIAAVKYCEVGRSAVYRDPCRSSLAAQLVSDISVVRPLLKRPDGMTNFASMRFDRRVNGFTKNKPWVCPEDQSESECELVNAGMDWLQARSLSREIDVQFDEAVKAARSDK